MKKFTPKVFQLCLDYGDEFYIANTEEEYWECYIKIIEGLIAGEALSRWDNNGGQLDMFDSNKGYSTQEQAERVLAIENENQKRHALSFWAGYTAYDTLYHLFKIHDVE